jgi:hypothetical protein
MEDNRGFFEAFFEPFRHLIFGYTAEEKKKIQENQKKINEDVEEREEAGKPPWYNPAEDFAEFPDFEKLSNTLLVVGLGLIFVMVIK